MCETGIFAASSENAEICTRLGKKKDIVFMEKKGVGVPSSKMTVRQEMHSSDGAQLPDVELSSCHSLLTIYSQKQR